MKKGILYSTALILTMGLFTACGDDDTTSNDGTVDLNITGLEDLGDDYVYEGWIIVDGNAITTGTFTVNENGNLSKKSFTVDNDELSGASTFVLTIEPTQDPDPAPSNVHILAGDFSGEDANLSIGHGAALGSNFDASEGKFILATPTDGENNNENSGVWFLEITSAGPTAGLSLPTLPDGWAYEGWAVIDNIPVSTGNFTSVSGADNQAIYSGDLDGPPYPGEDFIKNAPSGLNFPRDISGGTAVISIEPVPDNSANPFTLKPLLGPIPSDAVDHTVYNMNQNLSFPSGSATKKNDN